MGGTIMTPEDLDKLINDPKTWVVKEFNNISNIYLHLEEIEILITGLNLLIGQEIAGRNVIDLSSHHKQGQFKELLEKLYALDDRERSRN
jgi:hypothetical protein